MSLPQVCSTHQSDSVHTLSANQTLSMCTRSTIASSLSTANNILVPVHRTQKVHYHLMAEHTRMQIASHLNTGHLRLGSKTRHKNSKDLNSGPFEYQTHYNHLNTQLTALKISLDHTVVHFTCSFFNSITRQNSPIKGPVFT